MMNNSLWTKEDTHYSNNNENVKKFLRHTTYCMIMAGYELEAKDFECYLKELQRLVNKSIEIGDKMKGEGE